ncbi:FCD domain-containing protein [Methylocella sp. CPCC 101449]|uniref:GntR family transcriptional regulator n=1 Tax=Methylocella sp. CPCC 101449 TaxID=2987531 RepID=UPI0028922585|nr:FCD domain-containing protein [Methylocella sp. CPCC 101449]MDT2024499.1 FCD domain-containing protein [Methylocella sp. CPCC 101449]
MKRALGTEAIGDYRRPTPRTVAEQAYWMIRDDIQWGRLPPDLPLRFDELRKRYDIGISPLREALTRLASERLVTSVGQKGFRVASLTNADVLDTAATRLVIEREALRQSIEKGDVHWEMAVVAAFHGLARHSLPSPADDGASWQYFHREFHMTLISACGSRWQLEFAGLLFDQAERHRIVRTSITPEDTLVRDIQAEHQTIFDAVMARDAERAVAALTEHYEKTAQAVDAALTHGFRFAEPIGSSPTKS